MENLNTTQNGDIEALVALYNSQIRCESNRTSYWDNSDKHENHHQNGAYHINNPGTGWHETHTNSYFAR